MVMDESSWIDFNAGRYGVCRIPALRKAPSVDCLAVRDTGGSGPVFVLLHGWAADSALNWFSIYEPLSSMGRVVGVDLPGHGSSPARGPFSIEQSAKDVLATLAHYHVNNVLLIGYSMGGPVAQWMVRIAPQTVSGVVYVATAARLVANGPANTALVVAERLLGAGAGFMDTALRVGSRSSIVKQSLAGHAIEAVRYSSKKSLLQAGRELALFDSTKWVGNLSVPTVSIVTENDKTVPPKAQAELAELTKASTASVPYGHAFCLEKEFPAIITRAAKKLPTKDHTRRAAFADLSSASES